MEIDEKDERIDKIDQILNDEIDIDVNQEGEEAEFSSLQDKYQINSGEALNSSDIYRIAAKESTRMIVLVGPVASGKTTMETSLYQLFQNSPVNDFCFAGSYSLQGFEQRAFYTRIKSKGNEPTTQRTSLEDNQAFLHIRLWNRNNNVISNLILADISGEAFTNHIGQVDEAKISFPFIERADYVVGIIDGEKLCNKKTRNSIVSEMIEMIRTFWDAELITDGCVLQIVFSKFDLFSKVENHNLILEKIKQQIVARLSELFMDIEYYNVAAMPSTIDEFSVGYGLEDLLQGWVRKHVRKSSRKMEEPFDELTEYDRLYYKFLGELNE
ncbi:hypothetical protein ROSEINA2194_03301 [Roseburia inulinivorans DSM 16841]|uniref:Double-GTPase 2 domain-containing protein n=1 Tax=Roseburia inulinivorans DSM 16841 TaxID=622312 RepID=C0FX21_9FIRM|nr:hypothetical protein [Roseburia inulinivorans]EEG92868.1 hypothetical protein ROSEINA2194_03301 [Roseburia inulinivorans DSM 16841]MCC3343918.1 hypothetical protein [Roseburia inulinivorans DSM 16841]